MKTLALLAIAAMCVEPALAQVSVGPDGVRSGSTRIDSMGVHTPGADVTSAGERARSGSRGGTIVRTNGGRRAIDCGGHSLQLDGNSNQFEVANCSPVTINGNGNVVAARFASSGRLSVIGNRNRVTFSALRGVRVGTSNLGTRNVISRR